MKYHFFQRSVTTVMYQLLFVGVFLFCITQAAFATVPVTLTVNGGTNTGVLNDESVLLEWYAPGMANCSIDQGVGVIDGSELPSGSRTVVPPNNAQTTYTMTCDGGTDSSTVATIPVVSVGFSPNPAVIDPLSGVRWGSAWWNSTFATECGTMYYRNESGTVTHTIGAGDISGTTGLAVSGTSTISLECTNVVTGLTGLGTGIVNVVLPPGIPDPTVTITADTNPATYNSTWGAGEVRIRMTSANAQRCYYFATDDFGDPTNPTTFTGYRFVTEPWYRLSLDQTYGILENTTFRVRCTRDSDGKFAEASVEVFYDHDSGLDPLATVPTVIFNPPVPASVPVTNAVTGRGQVTFGYESSSANSCTFTAQRLNGSFYTLDGWNGQWDRSLSRPSVTLTLATSTTLGITCTRTFDGMVATTSATVILVPGTPAPAPVVTLTPSAPTVTPATNQSFAPVTIAWSSSFTTSCDIRRATTIGGTNYSFSNNSGTNHSVTVNISTTTDFFVECGRTGDQLKASATVRVTFNSGTGGGDASAAVAAGECFDGGGNAVPVPPGYIADLVTGDCVLRESDLRPTLLGVNAVENWIPNPVMGTYDNVEIRTIFANSGPHDVLLGENVSYRFSLDYDNDTTTVFDDDENYVNQFDSGLAAGASSPTLRVFSNVPFGTHRIRSRINLDPNTVNEGGASNLDDNTLYVNFQAPVPAPNLEISTTRRIVRSGQVVDVSWSVPVMYLLECEVFGPGMAGVAFDTTTDTTGSQASAPLTNTTAFTLTCTEPMTGTVFSEETLVEVEPAVEEL